MTDSLKKMLKSVDWSKMMSNGDARNALVGSALGGLMLGGASLMQDHDPEESKAAPVGDALMGALLGGAAGYGIPKGLALFRDSGTLAPDDDPLKPYSFSKGRYAAGAGIGGAAGAATATGFTLPAIRRALQDYKVQRAGEFASELAEHNEQIERIRQTLRTHMYTNNKLSPERVKDLVEDLKYRRRAVNVGIPKAIANDNAALKGIRGKINAINYVTDWSRNEAPPPRGQLLRGIREWLNNRTSGSRFAPSVKQMSVRPGDTKTVMPLVKMLKRVGKYGRRGALIGAAGVGGWHLLDKYLFGQNGHNNYAK